MVKLYLLGYKALNALEQLPSECNSIIDAVVIGQDTNVREDYSTSIAEEAAKRGIKFLYRKEDIKKSSKYSITIGWRWLIENPNNLIVFHDSILPRYRGFNPLVTALINGDKEIGVTALKGEKLFDSGDIIEQWTTSITYPIKIKKAIEIVSQGYANLLITVIEKLHKGEELVFRPQNTSKITYSVWRDKKDYFIDWEWEAKRIKRFIDAVGFPYTGAQTRLEDGTIVKVLDAEIWSLDKIENPGYGKVILKEGKHPVVVAKGGMIKLTDLRNEENQEIQLPKKLRYRFI